MTFLRLILFLNYYGRRFSSFFCFDYTGYTQKNGAENRLLPQLNTNYDDYILQLDSAAPPPPIFPEMYECFSIVFFNSAGSDVLQKETITFSIGHPVRRIKHHAISFFGGSLTF
jgi:hypothetical protein